MPSPRRTLLVVSVVPVWPPDNGFSLRASALLRQLTSRWDVVLAAPEAPGAPTPRWALRHHEPLSVGTKWAHLPAYHDPVGLGRTLRTVVAQWKPAAALFLCGSEYLALDVPGLPPSVADHVDCLAITALEGVSRAAPRARVGALRDAWAMLRFERTLARGMARTLVAGMRDATVLRRLGGGARVRLVPNGVDAAPTACRESLAPVPTAMFTGILDFAPNTDAALFLAREVWPRVRRALPEARLRIVGKRPPHALGAALEDASVTVQGNVPDVRAALQQTWAAVAPMRTGSGVKNKVLEAWGAGRAVVMTSRAVNGLAVPPGHEELVADSARGIAERVTGLLRDRERAMRLGEEALAFARREYSWGAVGERVSGVIEEVVGGRWEVVGEQGGARWETTGHPRLLVTHHPPPTTYHLPPTSPRSPATA